MNQVPAVAVARRLADDMLFPDASRVDGLDVLPAAHLDALAAAGLYGVAGPAEAGGLDLDLITASAVVEELASGCLATAFVWIQHHGLVRTLAGGWQASEAQDDWLAAACQGKLRGGIALAGLIPGPPMLRAEPVYAEPVYAEPVYAGQEPTGWRLDGTAPWVTGWGLVDLLLVMARGPGDTVVTLVLDAAPAPGLTVTRQRLAAVDASMTVQLGFDGVTVPAGRFAGQGRFDPAGSLRPEGLRINGSLALGIALRCCRLIGPGPLDDELAARRAQLDHALAGDATAMAQARAAANELALRAAAVLAVHAGSASSLAGQHPQRLTREAMFLLVFGSRPTIKAALLQRLGAARPERLRLRHAQTQGAVHRRQRDHQLGVLAGRGRGRDRSLCAEPGPYHHPRAASRGDQAAWRYRGTTVRCERS